MKNDRSLALQFKSCTENVKELTFIFSFAFKLEFIYRGQKNRNDFVTSLSHFLSRFDFS